MKTEAIRKNAVKRNDFDREKLLIIFTMACMAGLGTVLLFSGLMGIEIIEHNFSAFVGLVTGLTGLYFGAILLFQTENK